ncbi:hypothetical protein E4U46_006873 [Claviceps purpurea]|nr:hypothetical protein E4U10_007473 [Claviceps purpurea]KAG6284607.1 hypothetical protein E4U46_006873 [Claviceps purpurea]
MAPEKDLDSFSTRRLAFLVKGRHLFDKSMMALSKLKVKEIDHDKDAASEYEEGRVVSMSHTEPNWVANANQQR